MTAGASHASLLSTCFLACVSDASPQVAAMLDLALVSAAIGVRGGAAWAAVVGAVTFVVGLFNFLVAVTMSQVARAVGRKDWAELASRVSVALATAVVASALAIGLLLAVENPLYDLMMLTDTVRRVAASFYRLRLLIVLPLMVQRVCGGLLSGLQRIRMLACLNFLGAGADVAANYVALYPLGKGLPGATVASAVVAGLLAAVMLVLTLAVPLPSSSATGHGRTRLGYACCRSGRSRPRCSRKEAAGALEVEDEGSQHTEDDEDDDDNKERTPVPPPQQTTNHGCCQVVSDYLRASSNMIIRSTLLSASVWALAVVVGNLPSGTATPGLGAHAVVLSLWMATSYVCDGFADAGTMLGAKLLAERHYGQVIQVFRRLVAYGLVVGAVCAAGLWFLRDSIVGLFYAPSSSDKATAAVRAALVAVWPLLCAMQVPNALVFVYDGLIYATQSFAFVRNVMLVGCLAIFAPALALGFHFGHTLLWIWVAKSILNAWRCACAIWLIEIKFARRWRRERAQQSAADGSIEDPLLKTHSDDPELLVQ